MDQFITGDTWKKVQQLPAWKKSSRIACIAYVTSTQLDLQKGDVLICDASNYIIKYGETSASALQHYIIKGVRIYSKRGLHAKLMIVGDHLVIGSANLSSNSADKLDEGAVITTDPVLKSQAESFCHLIQQKAIKIDEKELARLLAIPVIKRPRMPVGRSSVRQKTFGDNIWVMDLMPIGDRLYEQIKNVVEPASTAVAREFKLKEDNISYVRMPDTTRFGKNVHHGDVLIIVWREHRTSPRKVFAPVSLLRVKRMKKFTYAFYEEPNNPTTVSWQKFIQFNRDHHTQLDFNKRRMRQLTKEQLEILTVLWKIL